MIAVRVVVLYPDKGAAGSSALRPPDFRWFQTGRFSLRQCSRQLLDRLSRWVLESHWQIASSRHEFRVARHARFHSEAPSAATEAARERFLARVGAHMDVQATTPPKAPPQPGCVQQAGRPDVRGGGVWPPEAHPVGTVS